MPGVGRTQKLAINAVRDHSPGQWAACGEPLAAELVGPAYGGCDEIEWLPAGPNPPGLRLRVARHLFREAACGCGHHSRYRSSRAAVLPSRSH